MLQLDLQKSWRSSDFHFLMGLDKQKSKTYHSQSTEKAKNPEGIHIHKQETAPNVSIRFEPPFLCFHSLPVASIYIHKVRNSYSRSGSIKSGHYQRKKFFRHEFLIVFRIIREQQFLNSYLGGKIVRMAFWGEAPFSRCHSFGSAFACVSSCFSLCHELVVFST